MKIQGKCFKGETFTLQIWGRMLMNEYTTLKIRLRITKGMPTSSPTFLRNFSKRKKFKLTVNQLVINVLL